jgi:hypothetical protein
VRRIAAARGASGGSVRPVPRLARVVTTSPTRLSQWARHGLIAIVGASGRLPQARATMGHAFRTARIARPGASARAT